MVNVLNKILTTLTIVTIRIGVQIVEAIIPSMQDIVRVGNWKREILGIKHRNNIPYNGAQKMIEGSKTTTHSQAVQHNKTQYKYERIVKKLIQQELGDWEGYINEIRASLDTNRISETPTTTTTTADSQISWRLI